MTQNSTRLILLLILLMFMQNRAIAQSDTLKVKPKKAPIVDNSNKKLLLHKMDPDNFNFGLGMDLNFNLIGTNFGNRVGNLLPRMSLYLTRPVNKYYINSFVSLWDYAIEPVAISYMSSREKNNDFQYGAYYFDPSFAFHLIPDRSSTDFKIILGMRPSYLMYSYSETLDNGIYRIVQGGLESNRNKAGSFDFAATIGLSLKFSQIGNFEVKYNHSFTDKSTSSYVMGRPSFLEFGIKLSAVQIGKTIFNLDIETQKQVLKYNKGTLLVMFPTPNINEINALKNQNRLAEIKQIYVVQNLNNKMIMEKMTKEYKFSKLLFFSDTSINQILSKNFNHVFINENYEAIPKPADFDSLNFFIASFCYDVSAYSDRNKLAYGLHVYDSKMQILSKPFNTMKNDMGLVSGNNIIADLMGKKVMFTPTEYESVIRKFNDRLFKNKMQDFDWE